MTDNFSRFYDEEEMKKWKHERDERIAKGMARIDLNEFSLRSNNKYLDSYLESAQVMLTAIETGQSDLDTLAPAMMQALQHSVELTIKALICDCLVVLQTYKLNDPKPSFYMSTHSLQKLYDRLNELLLIAKHQLPDNSLQELVKRFKEVRPDSEHDFIFRFERNNKDGKLSFPHPVDIPLHSFHDEVVTCIAKLVHCQASDGSNYYDSLEGQLWGDISTYENGVAQQEWEAERREAYRKAVADVVLESKKQLLEWVQREQSASTLEGKILLDFANEATKSMAGLQQWIEKRRRNDEAGSATLEECSQQLKALAHDANEKLNAEFPDFSFTIRL